MKKFTKYVLAVGGVLLILGAAGASDQNTMAMGEVLIRCLIGCGMSAVGVVL